MKAGRITWVLLMAVTVSGAAGYLAEYSTVSSNVNGRELPICSVETEDAKVALTFDVAWENGDLPEILDVLEEEGVKVSFFVTGEWAEQNPELLKKIRDLGHDLGNHSQDHKSMTQLTYEEKREEISEAHERVKEIAGVEMNLFRTPYGNYDDEVILTAEEQGYYTIEWNIDTMDWKDYGKKNILNTVMGNEELGNGAIIRAHAGTKYMAEALKPLIQRLKEAGYELVPVSKLIYRTDYHMDVRGRVVNQLANRRTRLRRDFDQIHAELFSLVKSVVRVHDDAGSVRHRDSDLGDPDFTIQTMTIFLFCRVIPTICYHLLTSMLV